MYYVAWFTSIPFKPERDIVVFCNFCNFCALYKYVCHFYRKPELKIIGLPPPTSYLIVKQFFKSFRKIIVEKTLQNIAEIFCIAKCCIIFASFSRKIRNFAKYKRMFTTFCIFKRKFSFAGNPNYSQPVSDLNFKTKIWTFPWFFWVSNQILRQKKEDSELWDRT